MDEGQRDLLHMYGIGYPEPNVVFALCRGSRSSPAVRTPMPTTHCQSPSCYTLAFFFFFPRYTD